MSILSLSVLEYVAVALNILYVVLAWKELKACWIFGGLASVLSIFYFAHPEVRLYSESILYAFYVVIAVYGFVVWSKPDHRPIHELDLSKHVLLIGAGVVGAALLFFIMSKFTDAARPIADSLSTTFSILATFLTIRKVLSNWVYWIVIDLFSVWLYSTRGADIYAIQMLVFAVLAVVGYLQWRKKKLEGGDGNLGTLDSELV